jgi:hypothetical protein
MREQQSVRPAPPRRMSAKQMNSSLLSGIFNGCNGSIVLIQCTAAVGQKRAMTVPKCSPQSGHCHQTSLPLHFGNPQNGDG